MRRQHFLSLAALTAVLGLGGWIALRPGPKPADPLSNRSTAAARQTPPPSAREERPSPARSPAAAGRAPAATHPHAKDLTALLEAGDASLKPGDLLLYADTLSLAELDRFVQAVQKSELAASLKKSLVVAAVRSAARTADIVDVLACVKGSVPAAFMPAAIQVSFNQSGSSVSACLAAARTLDAAFEEAAFSGLSFKISAVKDLSEIDLTPSDFRGPHGKDLANALSIRLTRESLATQITVFHQSLDLIGHETPEAAVFIASSSRIIPFEAWSEITRTTAGGTDPKGERFMIENLMKADPAKGMATLLDRPSTTAATQTERVRDAVQTWAEADAPATEAWWKGQQANFTPEAQDMIHADFAIDALRKKDKQAFERWYAQIKSEDIREELEQYR